LNTTENTPQKRKLEKKKKKEKEKKKKLTHSSFTQPYLGEFLHAETGPNIVGILPHTGTVTQQDHPCMPLHHDSGWGTRSQSHQAVTAPQHFQGFKGWMKNK
jgi:hypothetical protein